VLRRLGCSHAQGYLFGYPAPPKEIDELAYLAG
jgi:EAL domain-containing protein (putative c-di-GMP-specific phosphodiesterase class I)